MSISAGSSTGLLVSQLNLFASSPYTASRNPITGKVEYTYNAPAPVGIDSGTLAAALSASIGGSASATSAAATKVAPTPPWSSNSTAPAQSALVQAVQGGQAFFNPSAAQLDAPAGTHQQDYQGLFALYQGLTALQGLAQQASAANVTSVQQTQLQTTFAKGLSQLGSFVNSTTFQTIDVSEGAVTAKQQSSTGAAQETDTYVTKPLATGSTGTPVTAFQGSVAFAMQVKSLNGTTKTVNFNLGDMGATPRTMGNVVSYLNTQLATAGVQTRFGDVLNPGTPQTVQVNGVSKTISTTADTYSLQVKGSPLETLTFSAAASTPAIYLTSSTGAPGKTTTSLTTPSGGGAPTVTTTTGPSDVVQTLTKLDAGSDPVAIAPGDGQMFANTIANNPSAVRATATAPDGSVYVLADITGPTADGQAIKGTSDVALMKYDSAGTLQFTRTLGAANAANGYALSVSADGSQVAIAGTTTGPLDQTDTSQAAGTSSGFVSVYSSAGEEQWTQTRVSSAGDTPTAVTFGTGGQVFVAGTTQKAMLGGGGQVGGQDSYVEGFTGTQVTAGNGTQSWTSSIAFTQQFGSTGQDAPSGVAVSGNSLYVAGTENGHAVVRQYTLQATGAPTLAATQDLGNLQGGEVAGIAVKSDGSIVVAGATHNGALNGGTIGQAYVSGKEGFVATLAANLAPQKLNYVAAPADFSASDMTLSNGQVYLTGKLAEAPAPGQTTGSAGFVAEVDPTTGAVSWSRTLTGRDGIDAPTGIAVAQGGASALDTLGLPSGTINWSKSTTLAANTSVRPGDQFKLQVGSGLAQTITIQPGDTFVSLAAEINRIGGYQVSATTTTVNGKSVLQIVPLNQRTTVNLLNGPAGQDALPSLGLRAGELTLDAAVGSVTTSGAAEGKNTRSVLGLVMPPNLNISTIKGATAATSALSLSIAKLENLYQDMSKPPSTTSSASQQPLSTTLSNYYSSQLAGYQLALQRLGG